MKWVVTFLAQMFARADIDLHCRPASFSLVSDLLPLYLQSQRPGYLKECARAAVRLSIERKVADPARSKRLWAIAETMLAELEAKKTSQAS